MGTEFETQILEINHEELAEKLRKLGAKETKEILQKRWVYDIECLSHINPSMGEWIRLREANGKSTITYKNKRGTGLSETEEIEFEISDFEKAAEVLGKLKGFEGKYYQENKRHKFVLNGIEYTIDSWPKIPTFLEIEAESEEKVHEGIKLLGLSEKTHAHYGLITIYSKYGIDLRSYKEIRFDK